MQHDTFAKGIHKKDAIDKLNKSSLRSNRRNN